MTVKKPLSIEGKAEIKSLTLPELDYRLKELELVESIVDELDRRISVAASKDRGARLIDTIPGVGAYTALFLSSALDDVNRFQDSEHACACLGLVPSLHQSGHLSYSDHITRQGNKWLRRTWLNVHVGLLGKTLMQRFFLRVAHKGGKKKARLLRLLDAQEESNLRRACSLQER